MSLNPNTAPDTTWEINGHSFVLDLEDAETAERYENAFDKMAEAEKLLPKDGKMSVRIRAYCDLFKSLYDDIFGPGSGEKILGNKDNTRICNEVYDHFLAFVVKQRDSSAATTTALVSKYSPNRAQRRAAAKGGKGGGKK